MPRRTILTFVCLLPACAGLGSGPHKTGGTGDADGDAATSLASSYSLINHFSITAASQAPQPAYEILLALDADPGRALLALADAGGVPAAEQLFDALPSSLANRLGGWMTDAIGDDGIDEAQTLMQWSRSILADVEVHSSLEIDAINASGEGAATHTLDSLVFHVGDEIVEEDIPQIPSRPGAGHAVLTVQKTPGAGTLELGSHRFGLLFGHAAYQAFESMVLARYGTDVRGLLGQAIDCPSVADDVANRCVLGVCVGHRSMLVDHGLPKLSLARGFARYQHALLATRISDSAKAASPLEGGFSALAPTRFWVSGLHRHGSWFDDGRIRLCRAGFWVFVARALWGKALS